MPKIEIKGLKGLPGLNRLSDYERRAFYAANKDNFDENSFDFENTAEILFNNKQFVNKFGKAFFDKYNDGTEESYNLRNYILKDRIANEEFSKKYSPWSDPLSNSGKRDNSKGMGANWELYNSMSPDAKIELLESGWKSDDEFERDWEKTDYSKYTKNQIPSMSQYYANDALTGEMAKQHSKELNDKILQKVWNKDLKNTTNRFGDEVKAVYDEDNSKDSDVKKVFNEIFVKEGSPMVQMRKGELAAHINSQEMEKFGIDDMRKYIAKWKVYTKYMSPYAAAEAINNEAKEYIAAHQSTWEKTKAYIGDFAISTLSYTADKVNGFVNVSYAVADAEDGGIDVFVDDEGNIIDSSRNTPVRKRGDSYYYTDSEGKNHNVRIRKVARTTLRNLGKDLDGTENTSYLNPVYWTKAEQYGTLDRDEQKQLEQYGASPHTVAYNPNEEGNFWWEVFKMGTFGLADMAASLIPIGGGIGLVGKGFNTLSKVGNATNRLSRAMNAAGKFLINNSQKVAQLSNGTAGALGIAYAYNRGAFQETLEKNLGDAEEAIQRKAFDGVSERYNTDKKYKAYYDNRVKEKTAELKRNYIKQIRNSDGGMQIADMDAVNKYVESQAKAQIQQEEVNNAITELKKTPEYAQLQDRAIDEAGDAAFNTFWPEAIKYGIVNTVGFRKYLYTNPTGLKTKVSSAFRGMKEFATKEGRQRLKTESKFLTSGDKWKQFGKTVGSQMWGGAWTNGTDDMMTDAAERMSSDSFSNYINGFLNGEAIADTAMLSDGMYTLSKNINSYYKGLTNSLGQETTWRATEVGGLGSALSGNINFVNIGRLATRSGKEAYRKNFQEKYKRDDNGIIQRDEKGNPITENVSWRENWRDRAAYFIQNGILNTYYGKKQAERDLQSHADYLNQLLDDTNDFDDIVSLLASDKGLDDAVGTSDEKTMKFIKALRAAKVFSNFANSSKDLAKMSSVVQKVKGIMEAASDISFDNNGNMSSDRGIAQQYIAQNDPDFINNLVSAYYAHNPQVDHNPKNGRQAIATIVKNARDFQEASEAYNDAEKEIAKAEKNYGQPFDIPVREKLKLNRALDGHWRRRLDTMKQEIGDTSVDGDIADENILPSLGGAENAESLNRAYARQEKELQDELKEASLDVKAGHKSLENAKKELAENTDESKTYELQKQLSEAQAKFDDARLQEGYIKNQITSTIQKRARVNRAITTSEQEGVVTKQLLTADEIFALDPRTRARVMRKENRGLYSEEQKAEIEKLERRLTMQDADALQKIQDIALLTQRIETNKDAYNKVMQYPEAAAVAFDAQRNAAAEIGYSIINERNAQEIANFLKNAGSKVEGFRDLSDTEKQETIYRTLRQYSEVLLNIIDSDNLLPQYHQQVKDAKSWVKAVNDLDAVISIAARSKEEGWEDNIRRNVDNIIDSANNRDKVISNLEKAIDDIENPQAKQDLDLILKGMERLGYQRDAAVLENRKKKKDREAEARKKIEEKKKKVSDAAKAAAAEKAAKEEEAKNAAPEHEVPANGEGLVPTETITPEDAAPVNKVNADGSNLNQVMETPQFADKAKETGKSQTVSWASVLMDKDAEEGSVDAGEMWTGTKDKARQGNFTVTMKKSKSGVRTITFSNSKEPESLKLTDKEWHFTSSLKDIKNKTEDVLDNTYTTVSFEKLTEGVNTGVGFETYASDHSLDGINAKTPFTLEAIEITPDGTLYFDGTFEGHKGKFRVQGNERSFDLDSAIERQKEEREAELMSQGVDTDNPNIVIDGDNVEVRSENLDQQNEDSDNNFKEQHVSDSNTDISTANTVGESNIENSVNTLSGTAMPEYDHQELEENGVLKHRQGAKANDSMSRYFAWMKNAGIHLQNIIDDELSQILQKNPHAKVKFMTVRPDNNATDDIAMNSHLLLVLDYDDSVNKAITKIHNSDNGGVIKSNGKQYLIIGTVGYGSKRNTDKLALYDILFSNNPHSENGYGLVLRGRKKYFDEHPDERYCIPENLETEIVPNSLIPGYIVRQMEDDSNPEYRSITEILKDDKRNPHGLELSSLSWGIQEMSKYMTVGTSLEKVMVPRNTMRNLGSAFVLIPASNGKMVPAYLKPLFYNEMHDGKLKDRINGLLNQVTAADYKDRLAAALELCKIFYFDTKEKGGDNILLRQSRAEISLVSGGEVFATFTLDSNFDRQAFLDAFSTMNPRINITARVLQNENLLKEWDEAGALETDAAKLGTAGSAYSIYAVDSEGNMLAPKETVDNRQHQKPVDSDYRKDNRSQIVFKHKYYTRDNGTYYLNGVPVTDESTLQHLEYNRRVIESNLAPESTEGKWSYYVFSQGDNPEIVRVNKNTKEAVKLSDEESKAWLEKKAKAEAERQRAEAAKEALKQALENAEDVDLGLGDGTGETVITEGQQKESQEKQTSVEWQQYLYDVDADTQRIIDDARQRITKGVFHGNRNHTVDFNGLTSDAIEIALTDDEYKEQQRQFARYNANQITSAQLNEELKKLDDKIRQRVLTEFDKGDYHSLVNSGVIKDAKRGYEERRKQNPQKPSAPIAHTNTAYKATSATQSLTQLYKNPKHMIKISKLIKGKWKDAPKKVSELTEYLRKKNIEVDAIGTSQEDIDAWIKTIEECR